MAHDSGFAIQNTMSTVVLLNEVSDATGPALVAIKKSDIAINAPYFSGTTADFEIHYFIGKVAWCFR